MDFLNSQMDLAEFIRRFGKPYDPATDDYRCPPFASPVKAGKATVIYNAHSYHTKVPPQGIEPYIAHYTNPNDLVLDPFCGSGMTGVAALMQGRSAILNDLSPAAVHIAYNYCTPVDVAVLKQEYQRIKEVIKDEFDWLYGTTCDRCGGPAIIQYTVWSDVFECGRCGSDIVLWEVAVDAEKGKVRETFSCPNCSKEWHKAQLRFLKSEPVFIQYECQLCKPKRSQHSLTPNERNLIAEIAATDIPYWYPNNPLDPEWEMYIRGALNRRGITHVDHLFTRRNLRALGRLWQEFRNVADPRIISALQFIFSGILVTSTIMTRYNMGIRGNGPMSGLLYIPSLRVENNIGFTYQRKAKDIFEALSLEKFLPNDEFGFWGSVGSATALPEELYGKIDYIFTDPPFGQNLYYADLNFVTESWLESFTDRAYEAVVHREQTKNANDILDYARLMTEAFHKMQLVLKPGRWASVVFHNSDDKIWQTILQAAQEAGLELAEINSFDKEQLSYKGILGDKGQERVTNKDIVLNLRKPGPNITRQANGVNIARNGEAEGRIAQQIADFLASNPPPEKRTLQHFWNEVLYDMLAEGVVDVSMEKIGAILPYYFKQIDGRWYLRGETVAGGNVFDLKSDMGAIAWLNAVLSSKPQTIGDLIPSWQSITATFQGGDIDPGRLERLLEQNFWQDKRTNHWRPPTFKERELMSAAQDISAQAHLRVIHRFLEGEGDLKPNMRELAAWIQFTYHRGAYAETLALYDHIDESQFEPEHAQSIRKMIQVSRLKTRQ